MTRSLTQRRCIAGMPRKSVQDVLRLGKNILDAREKQGTSLSLMAERCYSNEATMVRVENGDPSVPIGVYAAVLFMLSMEGQLAKVGRHWRTEEEARMLNDAIRALVMKEPELR